MSELSSQLPPPNPVASPPTEPQPTEVRAMMPVDPRPIIGITMGDPGGVGAEVIVKALADPEIRKLARYVVFGLNELMAYVADLAEVEPYWWRDQHERFSLNSLPLPETLRDNYPHDVVVLDYDEFSILGLDHRGATKAGGTASMQFITDAIQAALKNKIDAIVTAPICKESWKLAGFDRWPGHTELLAEKTKAKRYAMMFAAPPTLKMEGQGSALMSHKGLRVVLCTIHQALFDLRNTFKIGTVFDPIDLANRALVEWFGIAKPRIAVCGLNPHASENGLFGDEEKRIIEPAIMMARQQGIDATGPFPADTIFIKAVQGQYDLVVAMYHDQGLIPVKLLDFAGSVNMTLGLPIIRTSPDHGTAFDIAGKNKADPGSIKAAILMAIEAAKTRRIPR
jgi:4-phospho-D-threonate 3-dehydrogenase / 4-phospho-D-erythronate 3-dehydrogenase